MSGTGDLTDAEMPETINSTEDARSDKKFEEHSEKYI